METEPSDRDLTLEEASAAPPLASWRHYSTADLLKFFEERARRAERDRIIGVIQGARVDSFDAAILPRMRSELLRRIPSEPLPTSPGGSAGEAVAGMIRDQKST